MKFIITDCETNGFRHRRIMSLAWLLTDITGTLLESGHYLIYPTTWKVPNEPWFIEHGFSQIKSLKEGYPIEDVLKLFKMSFDQADFIVAHNCEFDLPAIAKEAERCRIHLKQIQSICTMKHSKHHCKFTTKTGAIKQPKLQELYQFLFHKQFPSAHDAFQDAIACKESFFELLKRGVIKLPTVAI